MRLTKNWILIRKNYDTLLFKTIIKMNKADETTEGDPVL